MPGGPALRRAVGITRGLSLLPEQRLLVDASAPSEESLAAVGTEITCRFPGPGGARAMDSALRALVARHEALRIRLVRTQGLLTQQVADVSDPLPVEIASGGGDGPMPRPDPFTVGPLTARVRPGPGGAGQVTLCLHHIAYDGWSLSIIKRELAWLYHAAAAGDAVRAPEPGPQYSDYVRLREREREAAPGGGRLQSRARFWAQYLEGAVPALLPHGDDALPPVSPGSCWAPPAAIPAGPEVLGVFDQIARSRQEPAFSVLLAAVMLALSIALDREDILVSHLYHGRDRMETRHLVGLIGLRQLYLRQRLHDALRVRELLRSLWADWLNGIRHSGGPHAPLPGSGSLPVPPCPARSDPAARLVAVNLSGGRPKLAADDDAPVARLAWSGGGGALAHLPGISFLVAADLEQPSAGRLRAYHHGNSEASEEIRSFMKLLSAIFSQLAAADDDATVGSLRSSIWR